MKPWHTKWLTPFEALQLLVSIQRGDNCAASLASYSSSSWLTVSYRLQRGSEGDEHLEEVVPAFRVAEAKLVAWCRQGLISGFAMIDSQRVDLDEYWSNSREINFEHSFLSGKPVLRDVRLLGDDVRREARKVAHDASRAKKPARPAQAKVNDIVRRRHAGDSASRPSIPEDWEAVRAKHPGATRAQVEIARKLVEPDGGFRPGVPKGTKRKQITP